MRGIPDIAGGARAERAFLMRVVRFLVTEAGIRGIGCSLSSRQRWGTRYPGHPLDQHRWRPDGRLQFSWGVATELAA
jgi:hypothetical protein